MALINCPECGQEVSNLAPICIHCGYPLTKEQNNKNQDTISKNVFFKKMNIIQNKRIIILVACIVGVILIGYFGLFHLGADEKYTFDLIIENASEFKNPKDIEVISGTAGWSAEDEEPYAFVCLMSSNGYGANTTGYYLLGPNFVYDVSDDDSSVMFCKKDKLSIGNINRRLLLYWMFH